MSEAYDIDLREVARLLNLWQEHAWIATDRDALAVWVQESATRTRLPPRFHSAWLIAEQLQLIETRKDGLLTVSAIVANLWSSVTVALDDFPSQGALFVVKEMLAHEDYADILEQIFGSIQFTSNELNFKWSQIPVEVRQKRGWIWLQQLGLLKNDGDLVEIDSRLMPYVAQATPSFRRVSQKELDDRLEAQALMAALAEEYVVKIERERLREAGLDDLAEGVYRVSQEDVQAGYDVLSFEYGGSRRRIEVKASAGPRRSFFISRNEVSKARQFGNSYWLVWLSFCETLPDGGVQVSWFRDPAHILDQANGPWEMLADRYIVRRVNDDSAYEWTIAEGMK